MKWLDGGNNECPLCKGAISIEKMIPIYGRGGERQDPRSTIPGMYPFSINCKRLIYN